MPRQEAEIAWIIYDLVHNADSNRYVLTKGQTIYTGFDTSLNLITRSDAGDVDDFMQLLQNKLDDKLSNGTPPDNQTIDQIL